MRKNINKYGHEASKDQTQPKKKKRKIENSREMGEAEISDEEKWLKETREKEIAVIQDEIDRKNRQGNKRKN